MPATAHGGRNKASGDQVSEVRVSADIGDMTLSVYNVGIFYGPEK